LDDANFILPGNDIDFYYQHDVYDIPLQRETEADAWNGDPVVVEPDDNVEAFDDLIGATFLLDPIKAPNNIATQATVVK
jgi:hypothetical protein